MNLSRLNRFLLPNEKRIVRPTDLPSLPITTDEELNKFETFLSENDNITGTVSYNYIYLFLIVLCSKCFFICLIVNILLIDLLYESNYWL